MYQKKILYLYCLYNSWFCFKNEQKNYPQVYLEECKYKVKKIQLESDLESDVEEDLDSNATTED